MRSITSIDSTILNTPQLLTEPLYSSLTQAQQNQVKAIIEVWVNETDSTISAALLTSYQSDASLAHIYVGYAGTEELASQGQNGRWQHCDIGRLVVIENYLVVTTEQYFNS